MPLMGQLTYAEVLDAVTEKFPNQPPFLLKYKDRHVASCLLPAAGLHVQCREAAAMAAPQSAARPALLS